jgi:hypothetical protein
VLPGPEKVSLPKTMAILAPSPAKFHTSYFYTLFLGLHVYICAKIFSSKHFTMNSQPFFYYYSVLRTASFEENDRDNGPLATLITIKDTFSMFIIMFLPVYFRIYGIIFYGHI